MKNSYDCSFTDQEALEVMEKRWKHHGTVPEV